MDRALARMPSDRYGSAAEFARDVERAVRGAPATPVVDTEGATQLVGAAAAAGVIEKLTPTRVGGRRPEPTTPQTPTPAPSPPPLPKKRTPVVAIAASLAVLAAGGGGAYVLLSGGGGGGGAAPDSTTEAGTLVTNDTAGRLAGGDLGGGDPDGRTDGRTGGQPAGGAARETNPTGTEGTARPAADSAAIDNDLFALLDAVEDSTGRPAARERAQSYFNDSRVPANLRAFAASVVGQAYFADDRTADGCRWYREATRLAPTNATYARTLNLMSCPS
jgi:hypothetical protein